MHVLMLTQRVDADHDVLGFTVDWIRALATRDEVTRLDVLTGYEGTHDLPANVSVRSYGKERGLNKPRRVLTFERHCARYAFSGVVDVAFVHMIPNYVLASWPWFRAAGIPIVLWYAHGNVDRKLRIAHALADRIVTATPASYRLPGRKVEVLGHGIDTERFTPGDAEPERERLLAVGRVDPVKRVETLVDAVGILADQGRTMSLRIVGESTAYPDYYDSLLGRVNEQGITDRVAFTGTIPHDEIVGEYRRAGAFLNASRTGSLDKTEVEALSCGVPVISCNDAYGEMVRDSDLDANLLTFPPGEAEALADRIERVLDLDDATYEELRRDGRALAQERHDLRALAATLVSAFEAVTN